MKGVSRATAMEILKQVKKYFPNLNKVTKQERVRYLNAIENIAMTEGPEAITPERIQGMKELFEEVMWTDPVLYGTKKSS